MKDTQDVLIVGTGHAGAQAAIALRQRHFSGSITLCGEEPDFPYERPPLSKDYLSGDKSFEQLLIRPREFWERYDVKLKLGTQIVAVDALTHGATTAAGETMYYGHLVWAAGGKARRLTCDGHDLFGVHSVRSRADVDRMTTELAAVKHVVIIGAGYIGLEAAAVLTRMGRRVTVLEALDRVLNRVAGPDLSRFMAAEHRAHGVDFQFLSVVSCIEGQNGRVTAVRLANGGLIPCDMVIVGIGIVPEVGVLKAAGGLGTDGIAIDEYCRTSIKDVFAIGDCAQHRNAFAGNAAIRLESVQNANDMASVAADAISGHLRAYDALPWFWSEQYDLRLQSAGLSRGHDEAILRGNPATRAFSIIYLLEGRVIALDCVNTPRDYVQGRLLIAARAIINGATLGDVTVPLKSLVP